MNKSTHSKCFVDTVKIGILGGIGPESTSEFYSKLISKLQKSGMIKNNTEFPQIVINSIPAPELIHDTITKEELQAYILGLKELDSFGVDFIVMVCNTIHLYYDQLQKEIKTPIVDLRIEVKRVLIESKIKNAFILATPSTVKKGLYRFDCGNIIEPTKKELANLSDAVFCFNKGDNKQKQIDVVKNICEKHTRDFNLPVILGCTEFAVMLENENIHKINTIDILVNATIKKAEALKQRKNYKLNNLIIK
ncbi:amino acid racemase [archaeon]|nr:amino acid racemase [archaeon]